MVETALLPLQGLTATLAGNVLHPVRTWPQCDVNRTVVSKAILVVILAAVEMSVTCGCQPPSSPINIETNIRSLSKEQQRALDSSFQSITFDDIGGFKLDHFSLDPSDPHIRRVYQAYNGRSVMIEGEMLIPDSQEPLVDHFALCDPSDIVRSVAPPVQRQLLVYLTDDQRVKRHDNERVRVYGVLEVGMKEDQKLQMTTLYRLRLNHLVVISN